MKPTAVSVSGRGAYAWPGYWCECLLYEAAEHSVDLVASFDATRPEQAVRWVRVALRTLVSALSPEEAERAYDWLALGHHESTHRLRDGKPFSFSISHAGKRVEWTARQVLFLPLPHRKSGLLPPCVELYPGPLSARTKVVGE
ncbi:hypothetical protein GCM10009753_61190 [Streptantibioticus ferralitis]